jgi:hypothetical protein
MNKITSLKIKIMKNFYSTEMEENHRDYTTKFKTYNEDSKNDIYHGL